MLPVPVCETVEFSDATSPVTGVSKPAAVEPVVPFTAAVTPVPALTTLFETLTPAPTAPVAEATIPPVDASVVPSVAVTVVVSGTIGMLLPILDNVPVSDPALPVMVLSALVIGTIGLALDKALVTPLTVLPSGVTTELSAVVTGASGLVPAAPASVPVTELITPVTGASGLLPAAPASVLVSELTTPVTGASG